MADLVGIETAAKTLADALDRNVGKLNGLVTAIGTVTNTAIDKIDVALKRNIDNLFENVRSVLPKINIQTKE